MCIIAAKPANTKMPTYETLENMWYGNPDGAGIMYAIDGKVRIEKGLMTFKAFNDKLDELRKVVDLDAVPVVMHFRITTHGGTCPANTHPFPVTDSVKLLQRTSLAANIGVAHNGIIPITPRKGISDTMEYIASQLAPLSRACPSWYRNPDALTLVKNAIQSKMAVLTGKGELVTIGDFVESDGIKYSNSSFRGWGKYGRYSMYDWDGDDYCSSWNSKSYKSKSSKSSKKSNKAGSAVPAQLNTSKPEPKAVSIGRKALMWLVMKDECSFVTNNKGDVIEGVEFLVDSDNAVYVYDVNGDYAIKRPEYSAYTSNGTAMRFDENLADLEYVLEGDLPWAE